MSGTTDMQSKSAGRFFPSLPQIFGSKLLKSDARCLVNYRAKIYCCPCTNLSHSKKVSRAALRKGEILRKNHWPLLRLEARCKGSQLWHKKIDGSHFPLLSSFAIIINRAIQGVLPDWGLLSAELWPACNSGLCFFYFCSSE